MGRIPEGAQCHTQLQASEDGVLSLGNFKIVVQGAVVQADAFGNVSEADSALIELLTTGAQTQN